MLYQPQLKPYAHQKEALKFLGNNPARALFMGMRTGKTFVIITEFGQKLFRGDATQLLVIAPAGAYRTWAGELKKHMPYSVYKQLDIGIWQSGRTPPEFRQRYGNVLLVNAEAFSYGGAAGDYCREFLQRGDTIMVIDESTMIKSATSNRTLAICELRTLAKYRRILSGLPTPQSPLDTYAQFFFLDPTILAYHTFDDFKKRYAITKLIPVGTRKTRIVVGYKRVEEIHELIKGHVYRKQLKDCYDVPPKQYITRQVELTAEQRRLYDELKRYATTQLENGEHVTAAEVVTQILRLHQLCCGHVVDEQGDMYYVENNRVNDLMQLLGEYDGKAIVWCSYHPDLAEVVRRLRKEYGDKAVAQFHGRNKNERELESSRFETSPECRFMVATPGSGGRGRTWSMAELIVYYSNTNNLEHRDQSEERASGVGKTDRVTVVDFITPNTVEGKIVHALRNKIDLAATITGDSWREWIV